MEEERSKEVKSDTAKEAQKQQQIWSWGAGTDGQLGTGNLQDEYLPQLLHLPSLSSAGHVSTVACGGAHVIALTSGGKVLTWGRGSSGQLGHGVVGNTLYPKLVTFLESYFITNASAGWSHSGFVSDKGSVFTCGDGSFGQLGHGDYGSHCIPVKVSCFANNRVEQIACGMRHSLVLLKDCQGSQVYGFGSGKRGQLGISKDRIKSVSVPHTICGFENTDIISISANGDHSAALSADGHLYTWGRGFAGSSDSYTPQCLLSPLRFTQFAQGWNHALVLTGDGEVLMLGGKHHGVLSNLEKMSPVKHLADATQAGLDRVSGLDGVRVVQISAGAEHSALLTDGSVKTWGWGEHGQLGLGNTSDQTRPEAVDLCREVQNEEAIFNIYCGSGFTYAIRFKIRDNRAKAKPQRQSKRDAPSSSVSSIQVPTLRILDDNVVRAWYETSINILGLEWSHRPFLNKGGSSKVRLSFRLAEGISMPRVYAESTGVPSFIPGQ